MAAQGGRDGQEMHGGWNQSVHIGLVRLSRVAYSSRTLETWEKARLGP